MATKTFIYVYREYLVQKPVHFLKNLLRELKLRANVKVLDALSRDS